jgi:hypothetical protein
VLWASDDRGRVTAYYLADNQLIVEHPHRRQVLLDAWCRPGLAELLDVPGNMHQLNRIKPSKAPLLTPAEEIRHRPAIGGASVGIADIGGEELNEADGGVLACCGDLHRNEGVGSGDDQVVIH